MRDKLNITRRMCQVVLGTAALALLFTPVTGFAQSCSLCYTQAAASTLRFIQALRSGILILMIPPMFLSVGITVLTYQRRNSYRSETMQWTPDAEPDSDLEER